ncbi:MAG: TMEM175 family protein [Streptococcaceae bacterium]|jgi:uncharacterized membrane protein|nr:TMEM175 family protein [Streptococcaceae bacterium]
MNNSRISAFSDGVIAVLITIMVLELKTPEGSSWAALWDQKFVLVSYLVSFAVLAVYWNNHHHLFQLLKTVSGRILWTNLVLLFCFSLVPFTTSWMANYPASQAPELLFGLTILVSDMVYTLLGFEIYKQQDFVASYWRSIWFKKAVASGITAVLGLALALILKLPFIVMISVVTTLIPWIIPDSEIEKNVRADKTE